MLNDRDLIADDQPPRALETLYRGRPRRVQTLCGPIELRRRQEALRRGYGSVQETVYLGDGAAWVWENRRLNFPDAVEILDFYHASEHVGELAGALLGPGTAAAKEQQSAWCKRMKSEGATAIIGEARALAQRLGPALDPGRGESLDREINYLETNQSRTRYGEYCGQRREKRMKAAV